MNQLNILGRGNIYIGGAFAHSRRANLTVQTATYNTEVMALQNGTEVATGSQEITYYDVIEATGNASAPVFKTKYTAIGTTTGGVSNNDEIGRIYIMNADGTMGQEYKQVATIGQEAAYEFTYDSSSKTITFNDKNEKKNAPVFEDKLVCAYTYKTADTAQRIELHSDAIPALVLVTAYGIAKDVCTGDLFPCTVEGTAQVDGNWSFELTADGDPVVQDLTMNFVRGCVGNKLYDFTVSTEDEEGA